MSSIPSVSFSLAAIVRRRQTQCHHQESRELQPDQYVLVHERPPRGWWLPGGGVEHHDETPVHAAIRESVEEAAVPPLQSLLPLSQPAVEQSSSSIANEHSQGKEMKLPQITHLISLEQTPGRIRFIFRGEWIDDVQDGAGGILKRAPGDDDSIEARWITWNELQYLERRKPKGAVFERRELNIKPAESGQKANIISESARFIGDPWLRGHEPLTFFGMLESCRKHKTQVPGLPITIKKLKDECSMDNDDTVCVGAIFGRILNNDLNTHTSTRPLTSRGRAALITQLQSRLLVFDQAQNKVAIDIFTRKIPSSFVKHQERSTLRELVYNMIEKFSPNSFTKKQQNQQIGLLRVQHLIHENGHDATLTVFPFVCVSLNNADENCLIDGIEWVDVDDVSDLLEQHLANVVKDGRDGLSSLDLLRDSEDEIKICDSSKLHPETDALCTQPTLRSPEETEWLSNVHNSYESDF